MGAETTVALAETTEVRAATMARYVSNGIEGGRPRSSLIVPSWVTLHYMPDNLLLDWT